MDSIAGKWIIVTVNWNIMLLKGKTKRNYFLVGTCVGLISIKVKNSQFDSDEVLTTLCICKAFANLVRDTKSS